MWGMLRLVNCEGWVSDWDLMFDTIVFWNADYHLTFAGLAPLKNYEFGFRCVHCLVEYVI